MNNTLKTLLSVIALAVCAAGSLTHAADVTAPAPAAPATAKPNKAIERLQAQLLPLNLTDDQKAKVDAIVQDAEKSTADLKKDKAITKEDRQTERQELRQATLDKIREVLTPEQAAKFGKHAKAKGKVKATDKAEDPTDDKADNASTL